MKVHFKKIRLEKRHWVFLGLVAALCLTGIINMRLNSITGETQPIALKPSETPTQEQQSEEGAATSASANFFTNYRAERTATRDKEMTYLNEITPKPLLQPRPPRLWRSSAGRPASRRKTLRSSRKISFLGETLLINSRDGIIPMKN